METIVDVPEEEYEPPPHVFARLGGGVVRLCKLAFREPTRWRYVWPSLFLALTYASLAGPIFRHLPARFHAEWYWQFVRQSNLAAAWRSDHPSFWRLLALAAYQSVVRAPLREELLYRGLPIWIALLAERKLPPKPGRAAILLIAAVASLEFALIHNRMPWTLPIAQLAFGAMAWWIAWNRGIRYSILMHAAVNFLYLLLLVERIWLAK